MFARLHFPRFLVCCSGDLSDNESEEKPSVAICGGSICILTGLIGAAAFGFVGPDRWKKLPERLRGSASQNSFKRDLKTHLFINTF